MPRKRPPSSPAYTSSASPSPRPDALAPPVTTTSSTIFSGVDPGPPATDTAPERHTRMQKAAAKRRQPRRLPPLTSPMNHRGQGTVRYFIDICRRRNVVVEGTVLRRRAMDIDRISSDSDDIIEGAPFHEVIPGDLVISYDPAGFTYPVGRGGVEQPAVGHAPKD